MAKQKNTYNSFSFKKINMLPLAVNPHVRQCHERRNTIVKFVLKQYLEIEFVFVSYVLVVPTDLPTYCIH
jgi:hypothetical protein